eukprot:scaffold18721_cov48-Attheya_sp.AAC.2
MPLDKRVDVKVDRPVSDESSVAEKESYLLPTDEEEDDTREETEEISVIESMDNNKNNVSVPTTTPPSTNTTVNEKGTEENEENTSCAPMITKEKEDPSTHPKSSVHLSLLDLEDDDINEDDVARNNGNDNLSVPKVEEVGAVKWPMFRISSRLKHWIREIPS